MAAERPKCVGEGEAVQVDLEIFDALVFELDSSKASETSGDWTRIGMFVAKTAYVDIYSDEGNRSNRL